MLISLLLCQKGCVSQILPQNSSFCLILSDIQKLMLKSEKGADRERRASRGEMSTISLFASVHEAEDGRERELQAEFE